MIATLRYHIDNNKSTSENMDGIRTLIGYDTDCKITPIHILGGGGKYGREIKGIKGLSITHYTTFPTKYVNGFKIKSKSLGVTRKVLADYNGDIDIDKIKTITKEMESTR